MAAQDERTGGFGALSRLLEGRPRTVPGEKCDFCGTPLESERTGGHAHLVDLKDRRVLCACRPCYLLFTPKGAAQGRYKPVPVRYVELAGTQIDWDALQIPIGLAFFFFNSTLGKMVAFYPGPAGATESLLPLAAWDDLARSNAVLGSLEDDVEAVLAQRRHDGSQHCYIVPIDVCYELVGLIRKRWKGFDGGEEARAAVESFFARLHGKSENVRDQRARSTP